MTRNRRAVKYAEEHGIGYKAAVNAMRDRDRARHSVPIPATLRSPDGSPVHEAMIRMLSTWVKRLTWNVQDGPQRLAGYLSDPTLAEDGLSASLTLWLVPADAERLASAGGDPDGRLEVHLHPDAIDNLLERARRRTEEKKRPR